MVTLPVLGLPDFTQPFIVEMDAYGNGLRVVLLENHRPLTFFSQVLPLRAKGKSIYERELMAIVFTTPKWRHIC